MLPVPRKYVRPTQGVRQRLRDFLRDRGVVEPFRVDKGKHQTLRVKSAMRFPELPTYFDNYKVFWIRQEKFELNYEERIWAARQEQIRGLEVSTTKIFEQFKVFAPEFEAERESFFQCLLFGTSPPIRHEGFLASSVEEARRFIARRTPVKVVCGTEEAIKGLSGMGIPVVANSWYEGSIFLVMRARTVDEIRQQNNT